MDFDQADCDGVQHHLFSELDAGKVVVLDFIMLNCAPCIVATSSLEQIVKPYQSTHPGRVVIYSFGFLNAYTCPQLKAWVSNNDFTHTIFSGGEAQVNYYGGMGMPTFVVLGSNERKVYYNSYGYTSAQDPLIKAAIDEALLYNPTGIGEIPEASFRIFPTNFSDHLFVETAQFHGRLTFTLTDTMGRQVLSADIPGNGKLKLSTGDLPSGIYIARLNDGSGYSTGTRVMRQ